MKAKKRFKTPLDQLCSKHKITGPLHYIYFKKGFIYVSNGNVALKQRMELHGFSDKEIELLNGFCIDRDAFKLIKRFDVEAITVVSGSTLLTWEMGKSDFRLLLPQINETPGKGLILNQIDKAFDSFNMNETEEVALNPDYITLLRKTMVTESSGFTFRFNTKSGGVLVTPNKSNYKEHAIIMPLVVTGKYEKEL